MYYVLVLTALLACAQSHDVIVVGKTTGEVVYNETQQRSPALWQRNDNVTVSAGEDHIISKIVVVDNREDKDGYVRIADGGVGRQNVTLELKSPSILRGYDFYIEVYAVEGHEQIDQHPRDLTNTQQTDIVEDGQKLDPKDDSQKPTIDVPAKDIQTENKEKPDVQAVIPVTVAKDTQVNDGQETQDPMANVFQHPITNVPTADSESANKDKAPNPPKGIEEQRPVVAPSTLPVQESLPSKLTSEVKA